MKLKIIYRNISVLLLLVCLTTSISSGYAQQSYKLDTLETIFEEPDSSEVFLEQTLFSKLNSDTLVYQYNDSYTEDEGAETEDDILYASFDSDKIHYPKTDFSNKQ